MHFPATKNAFPAVAATAAALLLFPLTAPPALAYQDGADPEPEEQTPTVSARITVTASLPEIQVETTIPAEDLQNESDLAAAFRAAPGLDANRRGPINLEPTLRGLQENQIAMTVDGSRTFAAGPARMDSDLSHVNPLTVDEIRVVKGPYALMWSAGAMSAIDVVTWAPEFTAGGHRLSGALSLDYGANGNTSSGLARLAGATGSTRYAVTAGRRSGDDYDDGNGGSVPADYSSEDLSWLFGAQTGKGGLLQYNGGYQSQEDIDYPGRLLDANYFKTRSHNVKYLWNGERGLLRGFLVQAYTNRKDHLMNNDGKPTGRDAPGRRPPFALDIDLPTESNTEGARLSFDLRSAGDDGPRWTIGADHYRSHQQAERMVQRRSNGFLIFQDQVWPDSRTDNVGAFVQGVRDTQRASFGAAVRVDSVSAGIGHATEFFRANTEGTLDQEETNLSAALSAAFTLNDEWLLTLGAGRAVRTATTLERWSDRFPASKFQLPAEFMGNPSIEPEVSNEIDLHLQGRTGARLEVSATLFHRRIDDYITIAPDPSLPKRLPLSPPVVFRYVNGDASFLGGELGLSQRVNDVLSWRIEVESVRADDDTLDEPLLGIAPLTARAGLRLQTPSGRGWVDLSGTATEDQDRIATSRFEIPTDGAGIIDLAAAWTLRSGLEFRLRARNLTDAAYASHLNAKNPFNGMRILEPGRRVFAGISFRR